MGAQLSDGIAATGHPLLRGVRGRGLWLAVMLNRPAAARADSACQSRGYLVNAVQPDAIRLASPLVLSAAEADEFTVALPGILDEASK